MRAPYTRLYFHLVWATWDREPWLTKPIAECVYACILDECRSLGIEILALGGVEDHVHLLVRIPTTHSVATVVKQVKGVSSRAASRRNESGTFKWQGGYGAFSVSPSDKERVAAYIRGQKERHSGGALWASVERTEEEFTESVKPSGAME